MAIKEAPEGTELWHIYNDDGITLLHQAAVKDQPVIFRWLLKQAKDRIRQVDAYSIDTDIIKRWVNKKTNKEQFTAIHFASFNGNIEICQMLIEERADKNVRNAHGLNCLHVSAQGDQPGSLYFFHKIMHLNITDKDNRGSTPLHWAIFSMSELAMVYILAWLKIEELAQKDDEGFTAMHLAIKITERLESTRPVRSLIYNGAPSDIPDNEGNLPIDLARQIENPKMRDEILAQL